MHTSVVAEWSQACLHKLLMRVHHPGNSRKPQMEEVINIINICPTNHIQILYQHDFFKDFVCVLQMILLTKIKKIKIYVGTGAPQ